MDVKPARTGSRAQRRLFTRHKGQGQGAARAGAAALFPRVTSRLAERTLLEGTITEEKEGEGDRGRIPIEGHQEKGSANEQGMAYDHT